MKTTKRKVRIDRLLLLLAITGAAFYGLHEAFTPDPIDAKTNIVELHEDEEPLVRWLAEEEAEALLKEEEQYESLGKFKITYYCPGSCCNGSNAGLDCKGNPLRPGTIATNDLPYGTVVYIKWADVWCEYTVRDRMAKKQRSMPHIDIFVDAPHDQVQAMGVNYKEVYIKK